MLRDPRRWQRSFLFCQESINPDCSEVRVDCNLICWVFVLSRFTNRSGYSGSHDDCNGLWCVATNRKTVLVFCGSAATNRKTVWVFCVSAATNRKTVWVFCGSAATNRKTVWVFCGSAATLSIVLSLQLSPWFIKYRRFITIGFITERNNGCLEVDVNRE